MSFFKSNQKQNTVSNDILSQVRIMGEKSTSPLMPTGGNISKNTAPKDENPVSNPFIRNDDAPSFVANVSADPQFSQEPPSTSELPVAKTLNVTPLDTVSFQKKETGSLEKPEHSSKVLIIGSILTIALILIMGIFFYLEKVKDTELKAEADSQAKTESEQASKNSASEPVLEKASFSLERSNYLPLDTETATKESILTQIKDTSLKMQETAVTQPVSFQVTDENNIPLALNRFAFLADLKIPENLLASLDEDFNIVLYSDGGQIRIGFALKFKEELSEEPKNILTPLEPILPQSFASLMYPSDVILPGNITFNTGAYNNATVRYINVAPEKMYSFDYILQDKLFYLGNSKEATRKTFEVGIR